jgi:hypothetical protein
MVFTHRNLARALDAATPEGDARAIRILAGLLHQRAGMVGDDARVLVDLTNAASSLSTVVRIVGGVDSHAVEAAGLLDRAAAQLRVAAEAWAEPDRRS